MGHPTGTLRAERPLSRTRSPRFPGGHHWTAVGLAFCAIATVGTASAQGIWDDPAFSLYRQAAEAMDKKDYARASELSGQAIAQQPTHVLAHYLRGQAAMYQSRWDDAAAAFGKVVELYPGSFAGTATWAPPMSSSTASTTRPASTRRPSHCATRTTCACAWRSC